MTETWKYSQGAYVARIEIEIGDRRRVIEASGPSWVDTARLLEAIDELNDTDDDTPEEQETS